MPQDESSPAREGEAGEGPLWPCSDDPLDRGVWPCVTNEVAVRARSLWRGLGDARFVAGLLLSLRQAGGQGWGCGVMSS